MTRKRAILPAEKNRWRLIRFSTGAIVIISIWCHQTSQKIFLEQIFLRPIFVRRLGLRTGLTMFFLKHLKILNETKQEILNHLTSMINWSCYKKDAQTNINLINWTGVRNIRNILIGVDETACVKRGKKPDVFRSSRFNTKSVTLCCIYSLFIFFM